MNRLVGILFQLAGYPFLLIGVMALTFGPLFLFSKLMFTLTGGVPDPSAPSEVPIYLTLIMGIPAYFFGEMFIHRGRELQGVPRRNPSIPWWQDTILYRCVHFTGKILGWAGNVPG